MFLPWTFYLGLSTLDFLPWTVSQLAALLLILIMTQILKQRVKVLIRIIFTIVHLLVNIIILVEEHVRVTFEGYACSPFNLAGWCRIDSVRTRNPTTRLGSTSTILLRR